MKHRVFKQIRLQEPTWDDLGSILDQFGLQNGHSTSLNSTPFLTLRGAHFGGQIGPRSTQDRPKSALEALFVQKRDVSRNMTFSDGKRPKMPPRRHPKRPKIDPRPLQDDLQEHLFSTSFLASILVPHGCHFDLILTPLGPPKLGCA